MEMLITKTDISTRRDIAPSVKEAKINEYIRDAEFEDLRPLLGVTFYNEIIKTPTDFAALLDETAYEYDNKDYQHPGIKAVLADFAYARYIMFGSQTDTAFGYVEKNYQDGVQVPRDGRKERYKSLQQSAVSLWADVKLYLDRNKTTYPLWDACETKPSGIFMASKITT